VLWSRFGGAVISVVIVMMNDAVLLVFAVALAVTALVALARHEAD